MSALATTAATSSAFQRLQRAATALGFALVGDVPFGRYLLATPDGDVGFDCWAEVGTGGVVLLGPGWTTEERAAIRSVLR